MRAIWGIYPGDTSRLLAWPLGELAGEQGAWAKLF